MLLHSVFSNLPQFNGQTSYLKYYGYERGKINNFQSWLTKTLWPCQSVTADMLKSSWVFAVEPKEKCGFALGGSHVSLLLAVPTLFWGLWVKKAS